MIAALKKSIAKLRPTWLGVLLLIGILTGLAFWAVILFKVITLPYVVLTLSWLFISVCLNRSGRIPQQLFWRQEKIRQYHTFFLKYDINYGEPITDQFIQKVVTVIGELQEGRLKVFCRRLSKSMTQSLITSKSSIAIRATLKSKKCSLSQKRAAVIEYLNDERNKGKRLFCDIMRTFHNWDLYNRPSIESRSLATSPELSLQAGSSYSFPPVSSSNVSSVTTQLSVAAVQHQYRSKP